MFDPFKCKYDKVNLLLCHSQFFLFFIFFILRSSLFFIFFEVVFIFSFFWGRLHFSFFVEVAFMFFLFFFEVVFIFLFFFRSSSIFFWGRLSSRVKIRLHTENQPPRLSGSALKVWLGVSWVGRWGGSGPTHYVVTPSQVEVEFRFIFFYFFLGSLPFFHLFF